MLIFFPSYERKVKLTGVLLLHRISDTRMTELPRESLNIPQYDMDILENVILTTTMWDQDDERTSLAREETLREQIPLFLLTPRTARFLGTHESAWVIVDQLIECREPMPLQSEPKIVDGERSFETTASGSPPIRGIERLVVKTRAKIRRLRGRPKDNDSKDGSDQAGKKHRKLVKSPKKQSSRVFSTILRPLRRRSLSLATLPRDSLSDVSHPRMLSEVSLISVNTQPDVSER
jgi:hypothetical protein